MEMAISIELPVKAEGWADTQLRPLDESAWRTWIAKGQERERRTNAARTRAVKWVSIAALLAAAGPWILMDPLAVAIRFVITGGALVVMMQEFHARRFLFAGIFAVIAALYNPVAPAFPFAGEWQHAALLATVVPFVASAAWSGGRKETRLA
jgi:hypothetical protein